MKAVGEKLNSLLPRQPPQCTSVAHTTQTFIPDFRKNRQNRQSLRQTDVVLAVSQSNDRINASTWGRPPRERSTWPLASVCQEKRARKRGTRKRGRGNSVGYTGFWTSGFTAIVSFQVTELIVVQISVAPFPRCRCVASAGTTLPRRGYRDGGASPHFWRRSSLLFPLH